MQVDIVAEILFSPGTNWRFWYNTRNVVWLTMTGQRLVLSKKEHAISIWSCGKVIALISLEFPMCYVFHRGEFCSLSELSAFWPPPITKPEQDLLKLAAEYQPSEWEKQYADWSMVKLEEHLLAKAFHS